MKRNLVKLLGYDIDTFTFVDAVDYAYTNPGQIVTINPEFIEMAKQNKEFSLILSCADLVVPDGIGIEIGLKILGYKVKRIPGIELGKALINEFTNRGKRIALVGAKPEVIELAINNLKEEFKNINIVYAHDGYFKDESVILEEVKKSSPDLVLTALGAPKQEFFNYKLKQSLPNATLIGLGGSFDVWAGVVQRAPEIYQKLGLEWLYRTIMQPERFKRIFPTLPLFIINVIKERLK